MVKRKPAARANELAWTQGEVCIRHPKGDPTIQCLHCEKQFRGGATWIVVHFLGDEANSISLSPDCPEHILEELEAQLGVKRLARAKKVRSALMEKFLNTDTRVSPRLDPKSRPAAASQPGSSTDAAPSQPRGPIVEAFSKGRKGEADEAVARWLYATGVPFNATLSPYFPIALEKPTTALCGAL